MKNLLIFLYIIVCPLSLLSAKKNTKTTQRDPAVLLEQVVNAYFNYEFEEAKEAYADYMDLLQKKKLEPSEEFEILQSQLNIATNAFDRVEKIIVVDSLSVPADLFFKYYRLPISAGKLVSTSDLSDNPGIPEGEYAFMSEGSDYIMWSSLEADSTSVMFEAVKLLDGNWNVNKLNVGDNESDYIYPYMSGDGQTLYFASDGEDSMGGYDIFVAQRDPLTGDFLQPLNVGMPYNSPYNEYLMAIDEENGLGWWATDRNAPEGKLTIYVYIINEIRQNYPPSTDDLAGFARIDNYRQTQPEERKQEINNILKNLPQGDVVISEKPGDFEFTISGKKTYHKLSDFRNKKAAEQMSLYLNKLRDLKKTESDLKRMRKSYSEGNKNSANQIVELEEKLEKQQREAQLIKNEIYRLEKAKR